MKKTPSPHTPQRQFRGVYVPQEPVFPHGMDNREAASPTSNRKKDSMGLGTQVQARPGLSGKLDRAKLSKAPRDRSLKATG